MILARRFPAWAGWTAAVLVAGAVGVYFRLYPLTVFPRDLSVNNARVMVVSKMRHAAAEALGRREPRLSSVERLRRANAAIAQNLKSNPADFKRVVAQQARVLERETRTVTRGGFLLEVDPYYYLSQTERILRTGRFADQTRGREFLNPMTLAPNGYWYPMDLHPQIGACLVRAVRLLLPAIHTVAVVRWVPLLAALAALAVFAVFCRRIAGITGWPGFLGLAYLMMCPMFLKRSLVGWYDTDPYNVLFPLAAIAGLFAAFGPAASVRSRWIGAAGAGAAFALHALFWRGWLIPFLVFFLFVAAGLAIPRRFRPADLTVRLQTLLLLPIALLPFLVIGAVWGLAGLRQEAASAAEFARGFLQPGFKPWPDVFITVGELKPMGFWRLAQLLGGAFWVIAAVGGLALAILRRFRAPDGEPSRILPLIVLLGASCVCLAVSVRIQRFAILAAAPLAAAMPFAWEEWRRRAAEFLPVLFAPHAAQAVAARFRLIWAAATIAALAFLGARAHAEIVHFYPLYNPTWDRMMQQVRDRTPQDAIVTSWWSPGHFLTSMGQRRVTFDGSSQNEPQAYWTANLFLENSERNALGILRMLDTSGNAAVEHLTSRGSSIADAVELIRSIVPLSRRDAREKLTRRFSAEAADALLDLTHGRTSPPPAYLFVYNHMIEQALALEFIGRWNFRKAEAFEKYLREQPEEVDHRLLTRATPQNTKLLWTLSERPTFYESEGYQVANDGTHAVFSNGVRVNLKTWEAEIRGNARVNGRPSSVFRINDRNELIETPVERPTLTISVLLIEDAPAKAGGKSTYRSVIMGRRFAGSIAMRLYYLGGRGLKLIRPTALEDSAADRTRLGLFEVDWKGYDRLLENGGTPSGPTNAQKQTL